MSKRPSSNGSSPRSEPVPSPGLDRIGHVIQTPIGPPGLRPNPRRRLRNRNIGEAPRESPPFAAQRSTPQHNAGGLTHVRPPAESSPTESPTAVVSLPPSVGQPQATWNIGGSARMLNSLGIGGRRVRNSPHCIFEASLYSCSGPYMNFEFAIASHSTAPPL
jgi:hypothetical protein